MTGASLRRLGWAALFGAAASLGPTAARPFEVIDRKTSWVDPKYLTLRVGLGTTSLAHQEGINGDPGFSMVLSAGHHFTSWLEGEVFYQFSAFRFSSPDPVSAGTTLRSGALMNQEGLRFTLSYPSLLLQPFVRAGFGGYNIFGMGQETTLDFPVNWEIPVGAGFRAYFYRNLISFEFEFNYHFLFGENQPADTLALLGIPETSFNAYDAIASFRFHIW